MNKKLINRFYLGAEHIARAIQNGTNDSHTHNTLDAAIQQARAALESSSKDSVIIVKIVAVVKRKEQPIIVERL